jgi:hypothetical protein
MQRVTKKKTVDSVLAVAESAVEAEVEKKEEEKPSITFNAEEATVEEEKIPVAERLVRVMTNENHSCVIGGKRYSFVKGVCQNVPANVKTILKRAGKLSPL